MENKQSAQPLGFCQKVLSALGFRHRQRPPTPPTSTATKKNSSLPPPVPLAYEKPVPGEQPGKPSPAVTKREKEKKPITKPMPVVQADTRFIEVEYGNSSSPATVLKRKETIKEGGEKAKEPRDINEMAESFLKRARLKIRALSGVNDGKP